MASPYTTLVGAPPHPKTFAFRDWYYRLLGLRVSYCAPPTPRATNYYFAQAGSDSTGTGSQASPFKTLAKAQALISGSSGNIGVFFKRGDTWTETLGLTDNGHPNVTIGAWGPASAAKPTFEGSASGGAVDGVNVSGAGAWVDGIHVTGWGLSAAQNYCIKAMNYGTNAVLISNCDADTGYGHLIANFANNGSDVSGGITTVVACTAGGLVDPHGTAFNFYAYGGSQEFMVDSCVVTAGSSSGTSSGTIGVYSHTNGGSADSSLGIVNRLHCLAPASNAITYPVAFGAAPPASTALAAATHAEIDTLQEMASGNGLSPALTNAVRLNGVYNVMPPNAGSRAFGNNSVAGWWFNGIAVIDGTNVASSDVFAWWNGGSGYGTQYPSSFDWEHVAVLYQNWATKIGLEYWATATAGTSNWSSANAGCTIQNSVFAANLGQTAFVGLDQPGANGNGYFGIANDAVVGMMSADAHAIQLVDQPQIGNRNASPTAVSQLYQSSQPPADGVALEYDADWQPRNPAGQNVGPIEIVTANQLQSAQLVAILANTENCGGGSSTGAFAMAVAVTDGTDPIPGAAVRITGPQSAGAVSTSSAGIANFALNSGSMTVTTTATGYAGSTTEHTIDNLGHWDATGSGALTIPLAAAGASLSPGAGQTTAYLTTRDGQGEPIAGVKITFSLVDPQAAADSFDQATFTATSDSTGLLQILLRQSSTYQARLPAGPWTTFTTGSATSFALPEILGTYTD